MNTARVNILVKIQIQIERYEKKLEQLKADRARLTKSMTLEEHNEYFKRIV